jgi:hypothetical protein
MIIGAVGMGISMMIISVLMKTMGDPVYDDLTHKTNFQFADKSASNATIAFVYIYVFSFAMTWACVAWVYPPEVFSMNMRGRGTSMTSATNWFVVSQNLRPQFFGWPADVLQNFWFALYIPTAMDKISWELYLIFMALCYVMAIVIFLFYPESARKSLEEMDFLFSPDRSIWVFLDPGATKVGAIFERDMEHGEALTVFDKGGGVEQVEGDAASVGKDAV